MVKTGNHARLSDFVVTSRLLYLSIIACIVGICSGFVAIILMKMIGFFTNLFFYHRLRFSFVPDYPNHLGLAVIIVPVIGGLIIGLMARYGSEKIRGHGIPEALEAIMIGKSIMAPRVAVLKPISSAISIGSGGPFGAEGPIIMTGGSIGSIIGQLLHVTATERKILLVAGAAGGMAATFNAPIAAIFFAVELLIFEMRPRSIVPIGLASGIADYVRIHLVGGSPMFPSHAALAIDGRGLFTAIAFGLFGGVIAYLLTKAIYGVEDLFAKLPIHWMWWPALGGIIIGIGGYFVPQAMGVGYDTIGNMVQGHLVAALVISILIVKTLIWIVALGSGTSGGILAPLLIIGGSFGYGLAQFTHIGNPAAWALLGMAGAFAGVTRSPFTTIVFVLELTHDINMLMPLLITSVISMGLTAALLPRSILTEKIARRGLHISRDYMIDPLEVMKVSELATRRLVSLPIHLRLSEAINLFFDHPEKYAHQGYPILSEQNQLVGFATKSEILALSNRIDLCSRPIGDLFAKEVTTISLDQTGREAAIEMVKENVGRIIVVNNLGHTVGIVTRSDLLAARQKQWSEETHRSRHLFATSTKSVKTEHAVTL